MLSSFNARTGEVIAEISPTTPEELGAVCEAAASAFELWRSSTAAQRAALLTALATALASDRDHLVALADAETALGPMRLHGELDRTIFQLNRFSEIAARGMPFAVVDDPTVLGTPPHGHPAMQRWHVPLGPVAMFSASNFPFAFSVLGGDTAAALAAGCAVVVKAHTGHLLTSQRVFSLVRKVLVAQNLPEALVGMVQDSGNAIGVELMRHPAIAVGAFTGSTKGGTALAAEAAARARPIPFYGELGSINPVIAWPDKLASEGPALAAQLAGSMTLGCGQFCTSPGVLVLIDQPQPQIDTKTVNDEFLVRLIDALRQTQAHEMLTQGMRNAFEAGVNQWLEAGAHPLLRETAHAAPRPVLVQVPAEEFVAQEKLREEVFGPACVVVRAKSVAQVLQILDAIGGSLTVTLWGLEDETDTSASLVRGAMSIAGRVLFSGVPTGVAVTSAQHHGGPWPSSTRPESTSVGDSALMRFMRPICFQDAPDWIVSRQGRPV